MHFPHIRFWHFCSKRFRWTRSQVILVAPFWLRWPWITDILQLRVRIEWTLCSVRPSEAWPSHTSSNKSNSQEIEQQALTKKGYSDMVLNTLLASKKDFTKRVYRATWKKFRSWCLVKAIDPSKHKTRDLNLMQRFRIRPEYKHEMTGGCSSEYLGSGIW